MIKIRQLTLDDKDKLFNLIEMVEASLVDKSFWLPIKETAKENFFNESWTIFMGAFDEDYLIGASALFLNEYEYKETINELKLQNNLKFAEIGRCMVHPKYRGKNLMYKLNKELITISTQLNVDYIVSTVHPLNIPSNKSMLKLGMDKAGFYIKDNIYPRNIYIYNILRHRHLL